MFCSVVYMLVWYMNSYVNYISRYIYIPRLIRSVKWGVFINRILWQNLEFALVCHVSNISLKVLFNFSFIPFERQKQREREKKKNPNIVSFPKCPQQPELEPGTQNSIYFYRAGVRGPQTQTIIHCPPRYILAGSWKLNEKQRRQNQSFQHAIQESQGWPKPPHEMPLPSCFLKTPMNQ